MIGMSLTIHQTFLPADDPERRWPSTATRWVSRYATTSRYGGMRWITIGPPDQP